jgi:iron(III) transport system ATP-binding protein
VADNVAFGLKLRKVSRRDIATRVKKALEELSLGHLIDRFPHQLSGGQQQRVAIARALVYNPPVILMDEPLSNLDAKLREEARAWLRELIMQMQLSALVVTHDQSESMAMSDRILLLNNGVIEQQGTPQEMYGSPQTLFTADFMEATTACRARSPRSATARRFSRARAGSSGAVARPSAKSGAAGTGMIRLERVRVAEGPGENRIQPELTTSMFLGDKWEHIFHLGETTLRAHGATPSNAASTGWRSRARISGYSKEACNPHSTASTATPSSPKSCAHSRNAAPTSSPSNPSAAAMKGATSGS